MLAMAAAAVFMMSCSGDDSSNTNPEELGLLPKKMIETYTNGDTSTITYSYDGNKITGYTATGGYDIDYTYSGGFLTKTKMYLNDQLLEEITFTYDENDKLATRVKKNGNNAFKTVFTHNNNNTISLAYFTGNADEQTDPSGTSLMTMSNGNITSITNYEIDGSESYTEMYTFDNRHTPFKNVFARDILVLSDGRGGINNVLTNTIDTFPDNGIEFEYTYNSENLPVTRTDGIVGVEYIYE